MKQLPGRDAIFLALDTPEAPAHVGGLTLLDLGASGLDFERVCRVVDERIRLEPRFTMRLREVPLGLDRPWLVEDRDFDVRRHLHRIAVPTPGTLRELAELAGFLFSRPLDRRRPLWEMWWIEGVANGRGALLMKSHHCLMDGMGGAGLGELLCDLEPNPPRRPAAPKTLREAAEVSDLGVALRAAAGLARAPGRMLGLGGWALRQSAAALWAPRQPGDPPLPIQVPRVCFNAAVGPRRAFACASVPLEDVKAVRKHFDVSVNDVVLALTGSAVRRWLRERGELPRQSLVAMIAVSTRRPGDTSASNQVTMVPVSWATDVANPVKRLRRIGRSTTRAVERARSGDGELLTRLGEALPPALANLWVRATPAWLSTAFVPGNAVVSNVRATPVPLYVGGARIEAIYPMSVLAVGQGLNITAVSYMGRVDVGFTVDPDLVGDPWALAEGVPPALDELLEAARNRVRRAG